MRNSYPQELYTGVKNLWDSLKRTRKYCMYLTLSIRSMLVGEPLRRIARKRCLVLLAALFVFGNTANATANTPQQVNHTVEVKAPALMDGWSREIVRDSSIGDSFLYVNPRAYTTPEKK